MMLQKLGDCVFEHKIRFKSPPPPLLIVELEEAEWTQHLPTTQNRETHNVL